MGWARGSQKVIQVPKIPVQDPNSKGKAATWHSNPPTMSILQTSVTTSASPTTLSHHRDLGFRQAGGDGAQKQGDQLTGGSSVLRRADGPSQILRRLPCIRTPSYCVLRTTAARGYCSVPTPPFPSYTIPCPPSPLPGCCSWKPR